MILCISHCTAQVSACVRHSISMPTMVSGWAFVPRWFFVLTLSSCLSILYLFSSQFYLYSDLNSFFHVDNAKANNPCAPGNRGVLLLGRIHSSHRLWAQAPWRLPLLGDYWHDLPGGIRRQRYGAFVLVWFRTRRWDHRKSAIFTTVHSGEREEPANLRQAYHSHEESLLPAQSFFAHTSTVRPVHELGSCQK